MIESIKALFARIFETNLEKKSSNLLTTFNDTVKGLEEVAASAQKQKVKKSKESLEAKESASKKLVKAEDKKRIAIRKAEKIASAKVVNVEFSRDSKIKKNDIAIKRLSKVAEENVKIAGNIKKLIS